MGGGAIPADLLLLLPGQPVALAPIEQRDDKVEKWVHKLDISDAQLGNLWKIFDDRAHRGVLNKADYFQSILCVDRTSISDSFFGLIDRFDTEFLTFGDFINITCTICVLEKSQVLKFCFNLIDRKATGLVSKDELQFFVRKLWSAGQINSLKQGFDYIELSSRYLRGYLDMESVKDINHKYPQLFYPVFQFQIVVADTSLGKLWWENKTCDIRERMQEVKQHTELKKFASSILNEAVKAVKGDDRDPIQKMKNEQDKDAEKLENKKNGGHENASNNNAGEGDVEKSDASLLYGYLFDPYNTVGNRKKQLLEYERRHKLDEIGKIVPVVKTKQTPSFPSSAIPSASKPVVSPAPINEAPPAVVAAEPIGGGTGVSPSVKKKLENPYHKNNPSTKQKV